MRPYDVVLKRYVVKIMGDVVKNPDDVVKNQVYVVKLVINVVKVKDATMNKKESGRPFFQQRPSFLWKERYASFIRKNRNICNRCRSV